MKAYHKEIICIVTPSVNTYSETFIQNHIHNIPFRKIIIYGEPIPHIILNYPKWSLVSKVLFLADRFLYKILKIKTILLSSFWILFFRLYNIKYVLCEYGHTGESFQHTTVINNTQLIIHFHGYDAYSFPFLQKHKKLYKKLFLLSKKVIVVSEDMRAKIIDLGCPISKTELIRYGINTIFFSKTLDINYIDIQYFLTVGRFVNKKAPYLTILAFYEVQKKHPNIILKMVGDGYLLDTCIQLSKSLDIEAKIEFLGIKSSHEVAGLMSNAIGFVQHSVTAADGDSEGTPVAIMEAMAAGLPIVSTYHTGITEIIEHNMTGYLVKERDFISMANYMMEIIENPQKSLQIGLNAKQYAMDNLREEWQIEQLFNIITA